MTARVSEFEISLWERCAAFAMYLLHEQKLELRSDRSRSTMVDKRVGVLQNLAETVTTTVQTVQQCHVFPPPTTVGARGRPDCGRSALETLLILYGVLPHLGMVSMHRTSCSTTVSHRAASPLCPVSTVGYLHEKEYSHFVNSDIYCTAVVQSYDAALCWCRESNTIQAVYIMQQKYLLYFNPLKCTCCRVPYCCTSCCRTKLLTQLCS